MKKKIPIDDKIALLHLPDPKAQADLQAFLATNGNQDWSEIRTLSIQEAMNEKHVGKPVRVHAAISYVGNPAPLELTDGGKRFTTIDYQLIDLANNKIRSLGVRYDKFGDKIQKCFDKKAFYILKGTILSVIAPIPLSFRYYAFYLTDIEEELNAVDLIKLSSNQTAKAEKTINQYKSAPNGIFNYIKNTLVRKLGITGLDKATKLNKCIDYMILQSLSEGIYKNNSMKLHSLVIGAPGEGKKLLTIIAEILNPVFEEIPSAKLTNAGLIGKAVGFGKITLSIPGYLPRASGGVAAFQDFHELTGKKGNEIKASLAQAMEDGYVIDGTSARTKHEAITSIHADMNKLSQVLLSNGKGVSTDIDLRTNLLSRFDYIMDIAPNKKREFAVAQSIVNDIGEIRITREFVARPKWQIDLRAIIAVMRLNYKDIVVSPSVEKYIQLKLKIIFDDEKYSALPNGMMTRLAVSTTKFCVVTARINLRRRVYKSDIDLAFGFINEKIDFLSQLKSKSIAESNDDTGSTCY